MLTQLLYVSRSTAGVSPAELADIARLSSANNLRRGVTGALLYSNGFFVQMLEGDADTLDALLEKIGTDPRHKDVQVLARKAAVGREFADWGMAGLHEQDAPAHAARFQALSQRLADATSADAVADLPGPAVDLMLDMLGVLDAIRGEAA